ncbi:hypothetical protein NW754_015563 [Fusarium falciforme]|nr:hypothetical protein NW754_015563 [Fusarium falciforme]
MPDADGYTVGWICAVETEYVAARIFLDEIHDAPAFISQNDDNAYTLGRIGPHLVVIAVSPDGEYGINSAAAVARNMMHSFPNIRIGLMVGIGGGAPSDRHDIRLGDIVVSAPRNGYGGVFQYDYWKAVQDQDFQPVGILNQPPTLLRTTVNHLKAVYQAEGHGIEEAISQALDQKPRIKKRYGRPSFDSDQLYESGFIHPVEIETGCEGHCGLDATRLVQRTPRGEYEDNPVIHYGLIASGNQLMKDAMIRDQLAREKDVLCFEMEAAGLMNHFPCLVIRGICDYSDSHKSKEWQGYAAMAAAAYTRDLLLNIAPTRVQDERKLRDVVDNIAVAVEDTKVNAKRTIAHLDRDWDNEILDWLTPFDYASIQREHFSRSLAGTCRWFLGSDNFQQWLDTTDQTLFCTGIPGAGKTILASIVVNHLQECSRDEPTVGLAYVYCDYERQEEQTPDHMFASILKQLAQRYSLHFSLPEAVREMYDQHLRIQGITKSKVQPLLSEIMNYLPSVVELFSRVYIVVDALDEFQASGGRRSVFLKALLALQKNTGVNILATSRQLPDIQNCFRESVTCEITADEGDLERYVEDQMQHMPDFVQSDAELQNRIGLDISILNFGMFFYAVARLKALAEHPTAYDMELEQWEYPQGLFELYSQATRRIDRQSYARRRLAKMVLACIIYAFRPIDAAELQKAIALKTKELTAKGKFVPEQMFIPSVDMIMSVCKGLLSYDSNSKQFNLAHPTLRCYLVTEQLSHVSNEEGIHIPRTYCYAVLNKRDEAVFQENWLLDYMASSWDDARETEKDCGNAAGRLVEEASNVKVGSRSDVALDRNMSWLLVSPTQDC